MNEAQQILSVLIKESVQTKFEQKIDAVIEEKYSAKKDVKEQDEDENEENIEESDDDDEDDDEDDDDDEELKESMSVEYLEVGAKKGKKTEKTTISRHADLVKMANTGKYEWFMVTKKDGTEVEYTVDFEGKKPVLVEM